MTLNNSEEDRYAHLAELAEGETPLPTGPADSATGSAAAAIGRRLLLDALGSPEAVKKATTRGRPHVGAGGKSGASSPVIRVRVAPDREAALDALSRNLHRSRSELLREAVDALIERYTGADPHPVEAGTSRLQLDPAQIREISDQLRVVLNAVDELTPVGPRPTRS